MWLACSAINDMTINWSATRELKLCISFNYVIIYFIYCHTPQWPHVVNHYLGWRPGLLVKWLACPPYKHKVMGLIHIVAFLVYLLILCCRLFSHCAFNFACVCQAACLAMICHEQIQLYTCGLEVIKFSLKHLRWPIHRMLPRAEMRQLNICPPNAD